jgi:hypothetical protein
MYHSDVMTEQQLRFRLYQEAFVVGLGLVPLMFIADDIFPNMPKWGRVVVAGATFHLLAEGSGLNAWYLDNSVASQSRYADVYTGSYLRKDDWAETYRFANHRLY